MCKWAPSFFCPWTAVQAEPPCFAYIVMRAERSSSAAFCLTIWQGGEEMGGGFGGNNNFFWILIIIFLFFCFFDD